MVASCLDNAGNGGDAKSGSVLRGGNKGHGRRSRESTISVGNAHSGAGGQAPGGSVEDDDGALINILSCKSFDYQLYLAY
jgi:hypothetical protein